MLFNPGWVRYQAIGSWTFSYKKRLEICLSVHSRVMLDQVLERVPMTRLEGGLLAVIASTNIVLHLFFPVMSSSLTLRNFHASQVWLRSIQNMPWQGKSNRVPCTTNTISTPLPITADCPAFKLLSPKAEFAAFYFTDFKGAKRFLFQS